MGTSSCSCSSSRDLLIDQIPIHPKGPMPPKVPIPKHRHAAPSGPWPWQDLSLAREPPRQVTTPASVDLKDPAFQSQEKWYRYPQALFQNWSPEQCKNSKISEVSSQNNSRIYVADVDSRGKFHNRESRNEISIWEEMQQQLRSEETRLRCLFVDQMSDRVLKMIGTRYEIEPFFFSSSINWIPSRYQENIDPKGGDHITIVLPFIRAIQDSIDLSKESQASEDNERIHNESHVIDTQAPLLLHSNHILITDQLAIHLVRRPKPESSTMISYHQERDWLTTPAHYLHERLMDAGKSVYWQKIFERSPDSTFVLLSIMWYPLYAWDKALELLSAHIIYLEDLVIKTNDMSLIRQLHKIRGHLLHYTSLLANYRKSLEFLLATPNPAMTNFNDTDLDTESENTMKKECNNLLSEIDRLKELIEAQQRRLKNGISLEFATVNIKDMQATMKDSTAMVRISYLTALFLPSTFVATCFGMNINELVPGTAGNTVHVVLVAVGFTCFTIWLIFAVQRRESMVSGLKWPMHYLSNKIQIWPVKSKVKNVSPEDDIV